MTDKSEQNSYRLFIDNITQVHTAAAPMGCLFGLADGHWWYEPNPKDDPWTSTV